MALFSLPSASSSTIRQRSTSRAGSERARAQLAVFRAIAPRDPRARALGAQLDRRAR